MKKFLVIYTSPVSARDQMANATPEQAKAGMDAWMAWAAKAGKNIVDMGAPVGGSTSVALGGKTTDTKSSIGGYGVLQAESREQVVKLLAEHPHFHMPGAGIEVHEFIPMPGM